VIRATGKISARDRDGNLGTDAKMIADDIQIVSDQELRDYESTGRKMQKPKPSTKVTATRVSGDNPYKKSVAKVPAVTPSGPKPTPVKEDNRKLYVHIKNPDDHDSLLLLKQTCSDFPGLTDIVLVLGEGKKSAIKLPFKVETSDTLIGNLVRILGEDAVALK
jgi:hypothetical protein